MNLIDTPWLPCLLDNGTTRFLRVSEIVGTAGGCIPVRPGSGNQMVDQAIMQILIGFIQCLVPFSTFSDIGNVWKNVPTQERLQQSLQPYAQYFDLFGEKPAFQDITIIDQNIEPISGLFPGADGDLWGRSITEISLEVAAIILMFTQMNAQGAGRGHRTSLRGGGPVNTLIAVDGTSHPLWHNVLSNILPEDKFAALGNRSRDKDHMFGWVNRINGAMTSVNAPASIIYFGCPRRFLLANPVDGVCSITNKIGPVVTGYHTKAYGQEMPSSNWRHPLTPYYVKKEGSGSSTLLPCLGKSLSPNCAWSDYVGLVTGGGESGKDGSYLPAAVISAWTSSRRHRFNQEFPRVEVFGLRFDNAKFVGAALGSLPLFDVQDDDVELFRTWVSVMVNGATMVAGTLGKMITAAGRRADVNLDKGNREKVMSFFSKAVIDAACSEFWKRTESDFFCAIKKVIPLIRRCKSVSSEDVMKVSTDFYEHLREACMATYDETAQVTTTDDPEPVVFFRKELSIWISSSITLTAFGLPIPEDMQQRADERQTKKSDKVKKEK